MGYLHAWKYKGSRPQCQDCRKLQVHQVCCQALLPVKEQTQVNPQKLSHELKRLNTTVQVSCAVRNSAGAAAKRQVPLADAARHRRFSHLTPPARQAAGRRPLAARRRSHAQPRRARPAGGCNLPGCRCRWAGGACCPELGCTMGRCLSHQSGWVHQAHVVCELDGGQDGQARQQGRKVPARRWVASSTAFSCLRACGRRNERQAQQQSISSTDMDNQGVIPLSNASAHPRNPGKRTAAQATRWQARPAHWLPRCCCDRAA